MSDLCTQIREILEGGGGEPLGTGRFLSLVTLDSGARYGLDHEGRWVVVPADERPPVPFTVEDAHLMHEALEWKRNRFDDAIEKAAASAGLPKDDVVYSFPVVEVIRAVLGKRSAYLTRLALEWLRPSELRELRREILEVTTALNMPLPTRDLARRLVVPVG